MVKIKRGRKIKFGHFETYTWICVECGREWSSKNLAMNCYLNDHPDEIMLSYHDYIERPLNNEK